MIKEELILLGYTEKKADKIIACYTFHAYPEESLIKKIKDIYKFFLKLGYTEEEIIKMTSFCPQIYGNSEKNFTDKISAMLDSGYNWETIKKMTIYCSKLFTCDVESMENMINEMITLGYTKEQALKMTAKAPEIYGLGVKRLNDRIADMKKLGYTHEDILKMTIPYPKLYTLAMDTIINRKLNMKKLGYSEEEVRKMTVALSTIYGYTEDNMKRKVEYYNSIGLHQMTIDDPGQLRQGIDLSYARYEFYKDKGETITMDNYRELFLSKEKFEKKYGISNEEILEMYSYDEYIKENKNGRIA